jgi:hypothetical protein
MPVFFPTDWLSFTKPIRKGILERAGRLVLPMLVRA